MKVRLKKRGMWGMKVRLKKRGSHSLALLSVYIKGDTPFPEFSFTLKLDDITVGYFNSGTKTYVPRSLDNTEEDEHVIDPNILKTVSSYIHADHEDRHLYVKYDLNLTENIYVEQRLVVCELLDNDKPGQIITKNAIGGSTMDELYFYEGKYTYQNGLNLTAEKLKPHLDLSLWRYGNMYYPACIETLRGYLKKRGNQVKRKVKPRVRLLQRRRSVSGWDGVTCLATGFYPRHINLTILRDGQTVPDHLITGGELLPNGDGTYQMRKSLELSEEEQKKHNYTCTVTHLSLDNKLDVLLDLDPGEPIVPIVGSVVAALLLVCVIAAVCWITRRRKRRASSQGEYIYI
ncbi:major histocompatibility complex class I-related gene protein-like [Salminus brasiliensis]|uniref:major histocompatibility complex class I-related gene protein-like n=1 Tax=Salminus brasiliensis TaxID=930266 RepID=UPI003B82F7AA